MSAAPRLYQHPRVEMPRGYYIPPTRAVPTAPSADTTSPVVRAERPVRRLPVLRVPVADRVRAGLRSAVAKVGDEDPSQVDPLAIEVRGQWESGRTRKVTISVARLSARAIAAGAVVYPVHKHALGEGRPRTYDECCAVGLGTRVPCPFVSCKHHLYLEVNQRSGSIALHRPDVEVVDMEHTCDRAVTDEGGAQLDRIAVAMGLTRERVRQLEERALRKIQRAINARSPEAARDVLRALDERGDERGARLPAAPI